MDEPLVHLLRNAADHGIEGEAKRLLSGKQGVACIELKISSPNEFTEISVSDDGGGIDVLVLSSKALSKGLITESRLSEMTDSEKAELIFLPGLSTRDKSTAISGMGVGMDAVASWVMAKGGSVKVVSNQGTGTRITLSLPSSYCELG